MKTSDCEGRLTRRAHEEIALYLSSGAIAVDATAGNGHDTLFLAEHVGSEGKVFAFDCQEAAIDSTSARLEAADLQGRAELINDCHSKMKSHLRGNQVTTVVFNLGYLPGGDHDLVTTPTTTLTALQAAVDLMAEGGVLSVLLYPGHPGGCEEMEAVLAWAENLSEPWETELIMRNNGPPDAPRLLIARCLGTGES